jgi:hypothetical protein
MNVVSDFQCTLAESARIDDIKSPALVFLNKLQEFIFPRKVIQLAEPEHLLMPQEEESKETDLMIKKKI